MKTEAIHLLNVIQEARPALESITEDDASSKPIEGKWSLKEILGHLIDSAANNHQRFVRLQNHIKQIVSGVAPEEREKWRAE